MRKIQIRPLKGVHRLIQKNKEQRRNKKKKQISYNYETYLSQYEETIALATKLQYIR